MASLARPLLTPYLSELSGAPQIYIAYSGGLDSSVLLDAASAELPREKLRAVHINHHLSPNSDYWQEHCRQVCALLAIPFIHHQLRIEATGEGLEQAARRGRYDYFQALLQPGDFLLMAHHQDDQVETLIYRMLRGSGPKGLAGIPAARPLGEGQLLRPLLGYSRQHLETYAADKNLRWIHDESNDGTTFDRNYLRHEVIPAIAKRWPDYRQRLVRSAGQCAKANRLLVERAEQDLVAADRRSERLGASIDLAAFMGLSEPRQHNLLREWVAFEGLAPFGVHTLNAVMTDLVRAREDAAPRVSWRGGQFRRFRNRLFLLPPQPWGLAAPESGNCRVDVLPVAGLANPLPLGDGFELQFAPGQGGNALRVQPTDKIEIRFRQGGERCRPLGRSGSAPLKKLFQEYGLEPWLRNLAPLVYINGGLAAVADLFVCAGCGCDPGEVGVRVHWTGQTRQLQRELRGAPVAPPT